VPSAQVDEVVAPLAQYDPAGHATQLVWPTNDWYRPPSQRAQPDAPVAGWYEPAAQLVQLEAPALGHADPAEQGVHAVAPATAYVPVEQLEQPLVTSTAPVTDPYEPPGQLKHEVERTLLW
jgi:hypothetical protein